ADDELVAAQPRDDVAGPREAAEPPRRLAQELVARVVPERVVDVLEAVEVDVVQRNALPRLARPGERQWQLGGEARAVPEPRQRIEMGEERDLPVGELLLAGPPVE